MTAAVLRAAAPIRALPPLAAALCGGLVAMLLVQIAYLIGALL